MDKNSAVTIRILRSPLLENAEAVYSTYTVPLRDDRTNLLQALEDIYETQDDTLAFRRYCCGIQFCNSCVMNINGKNAHACMTILKAGDVYTVGPQTGRAVVRDLIVEA